MVIFPLKCPLRCAKLFVGHFLLSQTCHFPQFDLTESFSIDRGLGGVRARVTAGAEDPFGNTIPLWFLHPEGRS